MEYLLCTDSRGGRFVINSSTPFVILRKLGFLEIVVFDGSPSEVEFRVTLTEMPGHCDRYVIAKEFMEGRDR